MKVLSPRGLLRDLSRSRDSVPTPELASPEVLAQVWAYKRAKRLRSIAYAVSGLAAGGLLGVALFLGLPIMLHALMFLYGWDVVAFFFLLLSLWLASVGIRAVTRNSVSKVRRLPGVPRENGSPGGAHEQD
jgi:hypothetical protein